MTRRLLAMVCAVALCACSEAPSGPRETLSGQDGGRSQDDGSTAGGSLNRPVDLSDVDIELVAVATGFEAPLFVTHGGDGSGRIYVVEQTGTIRVVEGERLPRPFLDLSGSVTAGGEQGLLGLAFHPNFRENGRFYVDYTDTQGDTVVAEYRRSPDEPTLADPASERVLLRIDQPFPNHNGGGLAFGPDGYLYIATGDGGSAGDPLDNGQSLDTLLGKLLRIDVDAGATSAYEIPPDNPFTGREGVKQEIWSYGLRNPWRFSFDRVTDDLWIGDVGQSDLEEVDHVATGRGVNFGWNVMEGTSCFEPPSGCNRSGLEPPVAEYSHDLGCSITGGYVYRGRQLDALNGVYLFSDFCSGTIWGLDASAPGPQEPHTLFESGRAVSSFGEDESGELYVTDLGSGELLRVTLAR